MIAEHRGLDAELLAVELENQRLEDELFKLKMQRDKRRADDGEQGMSSLSPQHGARGPEGSLRAPERGRLLVASQRLQCRGVWGTFARVQQSPP